MSRAFPPAADALAQGRRLPLLRGAGAVLVAVGCALLAGSLHAAEDALEDPDYRFRLQSPGPEWRLLGEAEAKKMVPDALAGASRDGGVYGVVIVEAAGEASLADLPPLLLGNMPLEGREATPPEEVDFLGKQALRWRTRGRARGIALLYQHLVFLHQGFAYQLVAWGLEGRVAKDGSSFAPFLDAFWLLEGPVRARAALQHVAVADGVGWRVREGVFASAAYGIEVRPPEGWRLAVGGELRNMNASAEVGLVAADPEAYLVLVMERASGADRAAFLANLERKFEEAVGVSPSEERAAVSIDGRAVALRHFVVPGPPGVEFLQGAFVEGEICIQVLGWYLAGLRERARPHLLQAPSGIRFLDAREARLLAQEMEEGPDVQNRVGPTWSLRRGTYRDFAHGFTWAKPPGWWRVRTGDEARATNALAILHLEEPSRGIFGLVITEPAGDATVEAYHRAVLTNAFEDPDAVGEPEPLELGAAVALSNSGRRQMQELTFRYRATSVLHAGNAFQILFWGTPENMKAAARAVEEALRGFRFGSGLEPTRTTEEGYRDERLGYAMAPLGEGWTFADATPPEMAPFGSLVEWRKADRQSIALGALCALDEGQDEQWFLDVMVGQVMGSQEARSRRTAPTREPATLAGLPGTRLRWSGSPAIDLTFVRRDRTFYFLMTEHLGEPALAPDDLRAKVTFLD